MVIAAETAAMAKTFLVSPNHLRPFVILIQNLIKQATQSRNRPVLNAIQNSTSTEEMVSTEEMAIYLFAQEIIYEVCERFFTLPRRGQQPDFLGNFVLFAITEHLLEKQPGRPQYGLAAEFLRKLSNSSKPTAASARVRVHKLPRSEWNNFLLFVNDKFKRYSATLALLRRIAPGSAVD